jgi:CYTH domain-containing protein
MQVTPKYSIVEIERRWLVDAAKLGDYQGCPRRAIEDCYIAGTRLRLRRIEAASSEVVYKIGKKYGKTGKEVEPITNIYLSSAEYQRLKRLPGQTVRKIRYSLAGGSLDIYVSPNAGLAVFEVEFSSETAAQSYSPPDFVREEITGEPRYTGAALALQLD